MIEPKPIAEAPKDGTKIIVIGGWYEHPITEVRQEGLPSYVAWDALAGTWIMQDDHKSTYNDPKQWVATT